MGFISPFEKYTANTGGAGGTSENTAQAGGGTVGLDGEWTPAAGEEKPYNEWLPPEMQALVPKSGSSQSSQGSSSQASSSSSFSGLDKKQRDKLMGYTQPALQEAVQGMLPAIDEYAKRAGRMYEETGKRAIESGMGGMMQNLARRGVLQGSVGSDAMGAAVGQIADRAGAAGLQAGMQASQMRYGAANQLANVAALGKYSSANSSSRGSSTNTSRSNTFASDPLAAAKFYQDYGGGTYFDEDTGGGEETVIANNPNWRDELHPGRSNSTVITDGADTVVDTPDATGQETNYGMMVDPAEAKRQGASYEELYSNMGNNPAGGGYSNQNNYNQLQNMWDPSQWDYSNIDGTIG